MGPVGDISLATLCNSRARYLADEGPARLPDRDKPAATTAIRVSGYGYGFNPHPTRGPGATWCRALRPHETDMFQSSPDPRAGCDPHLVTLTVKNSTFQSSPDPRAGCDAP